MNNTQHPLYSLLNPSSPATSRPPQRHSTTELAGARVKVSLDNVRLSLNSVEVALLEVEGLGKTFKAEMKSLGKAVEEVSHEVDKSAEKTTEMISRTLSTTFSTLLTPSVSELSSSTKALETVATGFTKQLDSVSVALATAAKDTAKGVDSTKTAVCYSRTLATAANGRIETKLADEFGNITGREEKIGVVLEGMASKVDEGEKSLKAVEKTVKTIAKDVEFVRGKLETMEEEEMREMKLLRRRVESLEEESKVNTQNLSNQLAAISTSLAPLTALLPLLTQLLQTPPRPVDPPRSTTEHAPEPRSPLIPNHIDPPPCTQPPQSRASSLSSSIDSRTNALRNSESGGGNSMAGSSGSRTFSTPSFGRQSTTIAPILEESRTSQNGCGSSIVLPRSTPERVQPTSSCGPSLPEVLFPSNSWPPSVPFPSLDHRESAELTGPSATTSILASPKSNLHGPSPRAILPATHTQPLPASTTPATPHSPNLHPASAPHQQIPTDPVAEQQQQQLHASAPQGPRTASKKRRRIEQSDTEDEQVPEEVERSLERGSSRRRVIEQDWSQQSQVVGVEEMEVDVAMVGEEEDEEPLTQEEE